MHRRIMPLFYRPPRSLQALLTPPMCRFSLKNLTRSQIMRKPLAVLASLLIAVMLPIISRAADYAHDGEGFIRNWLMLAPIKLADSGADEIDKQQVKDEAKLAPKEGDKAKAGDAELTWKAIKAADSFFDVNEILGGQ